MAEDARRDRPRVSGEQESLSRRDRERVELRLGQELGDGGAQLAGRLVPHQVREPLCASLLRDLLQRGQLGARERARNADEANGGRVREDPELGAACELGGVLELEPEPRVWLVGAEAPVGFLERHRRERRLDLQAEALAPDRGEHLLLELEQLLAIGEGHLDVELRDLLDAIGAEILVPEADRDLVVAVEAGDHRQLLQDLRALGQREEAPVVQPARDDEVARPFGGGLEEDRRLDVEEPGRLHVAADDPDHLCTQPDVPLQPVTPQVEPAVTESQRLVDPLLVELERERRGA